jgi:NADH-quinone oxidoreductase subunit A
VKSGTFEVYSVKQARFCTTIEVFMLLEYIAIGVMIAVATLIAFIAIGMGELFGPKKKSAAKDIPYESGIVPYGEGTRRMPVRFYLIAVLFILFDIEVIFFLPWAIVFRQLGLFGLIEMGIFIIILLIGYVYAWKKGALEWE